MYTWRQGEGELPVLCLHETATTSEIWRPLAAELEPRATVLAYDRPGWGRTAAPETYARTTIGEQAALAAGLLQERGPERAVLCGAGLGAVVALELALRRPELALALVLVEPPLLAFVPAATEALSADADAVREAVAAGGREAALARYAAGELPALGAGAERIPPALRATGPEAAASLFAEIAAVPGWELPVTRMALAPLPSLVVCGADTPALLRDAAAGLAGTLARSEQREVGAGLPHHDQAAEVAELVVDAAEAV